MLAGLRLGGGVDRSEFARLDLVGLGQHDAVADRGGVEHFEHLAVDILEAVPAVDQHQRPFEHLTPAQIVVDQKTPLLDNILGRLRKAIARHVDKAEHQRIADVEIVELLRAPRRDRGSCKPVAIGQRVEQRRFADVRAAGKGDLRDARRGQMLECGRRFQKGDRTRKQLAGAFAAIFGRRIDLAHFTGAARSCGNLRYIHCCCAIDRQLLVIQ